MANTVEKVEYISINEAEHRVDSAFSEMKTKLDELNEQSSPGWKPPAVDCPLCKGNIQEWLFEREMKQILWRTLSRKFAILPENMLPPNERVQD